MHRRQWTSQQVTERAILSSGYWGIDHPSSRFSSGFFGFRISSPKYDRLLIDATSVYAKRSAQLLLSPRSISHLFSSVLLSSSGAQRIQHVRIARESYLESSPLKFSDSSRPVSSPGLADDIPLAVIPTCRTGIRHLRYAAVHHVI